MDLLPSEIATVTQQAPDHLILHPDYERFYPDGPIAGQILGYTGRDGRPSTAPWRIMNCSGRPARAAKASSRPSTPSSPATTAR